VIVALIPAHNESDVIEAAIASLHRQTLPPDQIIVVADNCTDDTIELAYAAGVEVFETVNNPHVKAGGLNQALRALLPGMAGDDFVLVMDADGTLDPGFIETAMHHAQADPKLGAVGGTFRGGPGGGLVGYLQRSEYARYARDVRRLKGKCLVVTGTAAFMRVETLHVVSAARLGGALPAGDGQGGIYDTTVLTEDNELTFALLHLGYRVLSPAGCTLETEVMTTWRALWNQRLRWKRGAIENCMQYGLTKVTWRYWGRQALTALGILITALYLTTLAVALIFQTGMSVQPVWMAVTAIFVLERVVTVKDRGWRHALLAATMFEVAYDLYLQSIHARAYLDVCTSSERSW
jgi:cellulose synthase/poly-beta-1,6-N-acetylglucosamine synthase-like glycosyltransferase